LFLLFKIELFGLVNSHNNNLVVRPYFFLLNVVRHGEQPVIFLADDEQIVKVLAVLVGLGLVFVLEFLYDL